MSLAALKKKAFTNQEVKEAYDELGDEFELIRGLKPNGTKTYANNK